ncbi:MAG TPA: 16S rRNA (guanine(966)-N(2))-methyltransferase RsmD [Elusimicrobiales bacterium]|nr:16S rRNA (guanine(966)-N(2))-methyltransferase RsmD [Elusimicrobiales bacterium]
MRIIAGTQRRRKLISVPISSGVKPISDRMKQSLFDILKPWVPGSIFLDLFSGTGAVGLEALSRGALKVVFADANPACIKTIKRNVEKFDFKEKSRIVKANLLLGLDRFYAYSDGEGYDIIFMGPPYRTIHNKMLNFTGKVIKSVADSDLLAKNGIIIAQHHAVEKFEVPKEFKIYRTEKYGDTIIDFLKKIS